MLAAHSHTSQGGVGKRGCLDARTRTFWDEIPGQRCLLPGLASRVSWARSFSLGPAPLLDVIWLCSGVSVRLLLITHVWALAWHREYYAWMRASPSGCSFPNLALEQGHATLLLEAGMSGSAEEHTKVCDEALHGHRILLPSESKISYNLQEPQEKRILQILGDATSENILESGLNTITNFPPIEILLS